MRWNLQENLRSAAQYAAVAILSLGLGSSAFGQEQPAKMELSGGQVSQLQTIAAERGLNVDDLVAAAKTYTPSGKHDEYITFASGGHSGQVFVIGVPSMRQ